MRDTLWIEQAPLTRDDIALLRRCSRGKTLTAIAALAVFLLLVGTSRRRGSASNSSMWTPARWGSGGCSSVSKTSPP